MLAAQKYCVGLEFTRGVVSGCAECSFTKKRYNSYLGVDKSNLLAYNDLLSRINERSQQTRKKNGLSQCFCRRAQGALLSK